MNQKKETNTSKAIFLIALCWLVYTISYFGKVNYSANITQVIDFYGVTKAQAGIVPTFFFFAYGVGQVINGLLCKRYNMKWMIFLSLIVSGSVNLTIAVTTNFAIVKWLWMLNGITLSVLWPTFIRQLSEALPKKALGLSSVLMGTTVAIGTLIIYGLSSVFAAIHNFKLSFYTAAISVFVVAVLWVIFYGKVTSIAKKERESEEGTQPQQSDAPVKQAPKKVASKALYILIGMLCFFAIGVNLTKDGLTTWVPSILKEAFSMSDSISILLTLFLPVLAVFGNAAALKMHEKIPDYANQCAVAFGIIGVFTCVIIASLSFEIVPVMLVSLVVVNFFASSLNSLITSVFPMFMRDKVNSGLIAGVLNGFCYLGSTLSSYGLGAIADHFGWTAVFITLIGFVVIAFAVWGVYICLKKYFAKRGESV